jgi:hypothetical protein
MDSARRGILAGRVLAVLAAFLLAAPSALAQVTLLDAPLRDGALPAGWTATDVTFATTADGYAHFTSLEATLTSPVLDLTGYENVVLTFRVAKLGSGGDGPITVDVSDDGGATWTAQTFDSPVPETSSYLHAGPVAIAAGGASVRLRFTRADSPSGKRLRDVRLTGEPSAEGPGGGPTLAAPSAPLAAFSTTVGEPSAARHYTVSGSGLEGDISVTAPEGFELGLDGVSFSRTAVVTQSGGEASASVYVRLSGAAPGAFSGAVTHASPGAVSRQVAVSGVVQTLGGPEGPVAGSVFVSARPDAAEAARVVPNEAWGVHAPGEPVRVSPGDWRYDGTRVTLFLVPTEGTTLASASLTVAWDEGVLGLVEASATGGLFDGSPFFTMRPEGSAGRVRIDASRPANHTVANVAGGGQYIAALTFELLRPGHAEVTIEGLDLRAYDGVGQVAVPATSHGGDLRAYLGDGAAPGEASRGDGRVDFEDLLLFSEAYWAGVPGGPDPAGTRYRVKFDVGPTADGTVFSFPEVDGQIQFEDLVVFSLSYGLSATGAYARPVRAVEKGMIALATAPARAAGGELRVPVTVSEVAHLRVLALSFALDTEAFEVLGASRPEGGLIDADTPFFAAAYAASGAGMADVARLGGSGMSGAGEVVELRIRPRSGRVADFVGATDLVSLTAATLRTSGNTELPVALGASTRSEDGLAPEAYSLAASYPNPVTASATIAFALPEAAHVRLAVYDALGRLVQVLEDGAVAAGTHRASLDATALAPGAYFYRLEAGPYVETRRLMVVR